MAKTEIPSFKNDEGKAKIEIATRQFKCVGASSPQDHPHIFLNMGEASQIVCPYCSTLYVYKSKSS